MRTNKYSTRRGFIRQSSLGLGAGIAGFGAFGGQERSTKTEKLPGEIRVAGIDLKGLLHDVNTDTRMKGILERMDEVSGLQPDIICLPELFATMWVREQKSLAEVAEDEQVPGRLTGMIASFAKINNCYVVCPLVTKKDGGYYNSSILVDRGGKIAGVYHKTHPAKSELLPDQDYPGSSIIPGALDQPVIQTDFGKVGMQLCYDANWPEGWEYLKKKGAEIILFSSAFSGGKMLNYLALQNNFYILSATGKDARVIDISGNDLDCTSEFIRYAWATISLDKVNVTTWPTNGALPDLFKKYGDRLGIKVWGSTDVITIENRDPGLQLSAVLKEFEIPTYEELLKNETEVQNKYRL